MSFDFSLLRQRWETERREAIRRSESIKLELVKKGVPILQRYGVQKAILFGSIAEGASRIDSDIDLLAMPLPAEKYWRCLFDLQQNLERRVDLYTETDDPVLVRKIFERGEILYEFPAGAVEG